MDADDDAEPDNKDQFEPADNIGGKWLSEMCLETFNDACSALEAIHFIISPTFLTDSFIFPLPYSCEVCDLCSVALWEIDDLLGNWAHFLEKSQLW